jgi:hypothetical protein
LFGNQDAQKPSLFQSEVATNKSDPEIKNVEAPKISLFV